MKQTCDLVLPGSDESLLVCILRQFLHQGGLTDKEEKCFTVFILQLVQVLY